MKALAPRDASPELAEAERLMRQGVYYAGGNLVLADELDRLRREVARLESEKKSLREASPGFRKQVDAIDRWQKLHDEDGGGEGIAVDWVENLASEADVAIAEAERRGRRDAEQTARLALFWLTGKGSRKQARDVLTNYLEALKRDACTPSDGGKNDGNG